MELQHSDLLQTLNMIDLAAIVPAQFAIITGGKSKDGCPLIIFPDNANFHLLSDNEYQQLMLYLTSVPSLQETDMGFHLIIDRRKDRWNSVKAVLLKISVYFPALIHVVYVIRPASFLQKALSEVSNKLFKDEFKFRVIVLSTVDELHDYVDTNQLTSDLGGNLTYSHEEWIKQRNALEEFSAMTQKVSLALDEFTKTINETECPNNVDYTQELLNQQTTVFSGLKEEILGAARHGESLLSKMRESSGSKRNSCDNYPDLTGNVIMIERLLVQLEETEKTFDKFWQLHSIKLCHCLTLRRFEQDFRELQINFNLHLRTISEMVEVGATLKRTETLIHETLGFEKLCLIDIERAEEVFSSGDQLLGIKNSFPNECIEPKCKELTRIRDVLLLKLSKRMETLVKCKHILEQIEKANEWSANGIEMLALQNSDKYCSSIDLAKQSLNEIQQFISLFDYHKLQDSDALKNVFSDSIPPETKEVVGQALRRIEEVSLACDQRIASIKSIIATIPVTHINRPVFRKANTMPRIDSSDENVQIITNELNDHHSSSEIDVARYEMHKSKRGHVLNELLETERVYVAELWTILKGYKMEAESEAMQSLVPPGLLEKIDVLFGNLDELYHFHAELFLKDIENCITTTELVALCFVQRRDIFYRLYSYYCQNIPRSEQLRETLVDSNMFFQTCQCKLGHKLPLAAYLLKPVQRITKYQLLLKDLLRYSNEKESCRELQQALDCMLVVLKCVNDSMHQISISGFPVDLSQQGELLLQGSFSVWSENKKDLKLRIKPMQRHIFLYQKALLFCKPRSKSAHNKTIYHYKHYLKLSQIGLTESVKGDTRKFELWLQGRQEVYTIQAITIEQKETWVNAIKRVLLNQLEELKGEKIKQYSLVVHKTLRQTTSWESQRVTIIPQLNNEHTINCDSENHVPSVGLDEEQVDTIENSNWSSDCSNSDEEDHQSNTAVVNGRYVALADYCAMGISEVNMKEGDIVELLKVGCAGWWFVKVIGTTNEGWAPAAYLENLNRRTSHSSSRSQDKLHDH